MIKRLADEAAALFLRQSDIGLGEGSGLDLALHHGFETVPRAVGGATDVYQLARDKPFQHVQSEIMRAEIERHPDGAARQLLRGIDWGIRAYH